MHEQQDRFDFSLFGRWSHVSELLLTGNILALSLVIAKHNGISAGIWQDIVSGGLFVSWVTISFAVVVHQLHAYLQAIKPWMALLLCMIFLFVLIVVSRLFIYGLQSGFVLNLAAYPWQIALHHAVLGSAWGVICLRYLYVREQANRRQQAELQARVQALQARIHPHFLFNSLNSMVSLIAVDPTKAEQMLIDLSQLFRASLSESREVALREEIALCQRYLQIESIRLGERLTVDWRITDEAKIAQAKIPLLTLQPLLENSIYHGIESIQKPGVVRILIEVNQRQVNIVLTNPYQTKPRHHQRNGIALENIRQRLIAFYGATVAFKTVAGNGLFTTIISYRY